MVVIIHISLNPAVMHVNITTTKKKTLLLHRRVANVVRQWRIWHCTTTTRTQLRDLARLDSTTNDGVSHVFSLSPSPLLYNPLAGWWMNLLSPDLKANHSRCFFCLETSWRDRDVALCNGHCRTGGWRTADVVLHDRMRWGRLVFSFPPAEALETLVS